MKSQISDKYEFCRPIVEKHMRARGLYLWPEAVLAAIEAVTEILELIEEKKCEK